MRLAAAVLFWILTGGAAAAHETGSLQPDAFWRAWSFDPLVLVPLGLALALYARGLRCLWTRAGRGRGLTYLHASSFALGAAVLVAALVSPLDALGGTLLAAHMAQHALLVAVAPPLLLLGKPGVVFAWALPADRRRTVLGSATWRALARAGNALSRPLPAAALHGIALWFWHAPAAFNAALASHGIHVLEHAAFFGTAMLFWRAVLEARAASRRAARALGAAFATLIHGGLLGALITLAPYPLYIWYRGRTELWGWSALEDQQLAGLLMWVPMGVVYLAACLVLAGRLVMGETANRGLDVAERRHDAPRQAS